MMQQHLTNDDLDLAKIISYLKTKYHLDALSPVAQMGTVMPASPDRGQLCSYHTDEAASLSEGITLIGTTRAVGNEQIAVMLTLSPEVITALLQRIHFLDRVL